MTIAAAPAPRPAPRPTATPKPPTTRYNRAPPQPTIATPRPASLPTPIPTTPTDPNPEALCDELHLAQLILEENLDRHITYEPLGMPARNVFATEAAYLDLCIQIVESEIELLRSIAIPLTTPKPRTKPTVSAATKSSLRAHLTPAPRHNPVTFVPATTTQPPAPLAP